jgi:hypothetical protein
MSIFGDDSLIRFLGFPILPIAPSTSADVYKIFDQLDVLGLKISKNRTCKGMTYLVPIGCLIPSLIASETERELRRVWVSLRRSNNRSDLLLLLSPMEFRSNSSLISTEPRVSKSAATSRERER